MSPPTNGLLLLQGLDSHPCCHRQLTSPYALAAISASLTNSPNLLQPREDQKANLCDQETLHLGCGGKREVAAALKYLSAKSGNQGLESTELFPMRLAALVHQ